MAIQKTPPLGWPHTEAEAHRARESLEILQKGEELGHGKAKPPKPGAERRSGCGCFGGIVLTLILLALAGVIIAVIANEFTSSGSAQDAFTDAHPTWEIESFDEPNGEGGEVRIVAWDYDRDVGRIVVMEPVQEGGYIERPIITGGQVPAWEEEELLDAFGSEYSSLSWSYIMEAEKLGGPADGSTETWRVTYRVWPMETGEEWTEVLSTTAMRVPTSGTWDVVGPDEVDTSSDPAQSAEDTAATE